MNFEFTGRHIEVTPALRAHVEEQFKKLEDVFDGKLERFGHVPIVDPNDHKDRDTGAAAKGKGDR